MFSLVLELDQITKQKPKNKTSNQLLVEEKANHS